LIVKICGITRQEDLSAAARAGCDMVGFITGFPSSPRNLPLREAVRLVGMTPEGLKPVIVCPAWDQALIDEAVHEASPWAVQLNGEGYSRVKGAKTIRAISMTERFDMETALRLAMESDFVLADSSRGGLGGTGWTHDWLLSKRLREMIHPKPLLLSGGLTPENIQQAILTVRPSGVDVASGVEARPAVKDHGKMLAFVARAKSAELQGR